METFEIKSIDRDEKIMIYKSDIADLTKENILLQNCLDCV